MNSRRRGSSQKRVDRITDAAIADERRSLRAAAESQRLAAKLASSPRCARELDDGSTCGHELAYHDPCSRCRCPGFVAA